MVVALVAAFAAYGPAHMARGVCSGSGRFRDYAIVLGSDGVVRIVLCVALAVVGVTATGAYGLAIAISPLFAVAYVYRRGALDTDPGPPAAWSEVTPNLGWLLVGSVCGAALLNAGPIAAQLLSGTSDVDKARFANLFEHVAENMLDRRDAMHFIERVFEVGIGAVKLGKFGDAFGG